MPDAALVECFRRGGGGTKPVYGGLKVCWGTDRQEALRTAHRLWANERLPGELAQILPTPRQFEQASDLVTGDHMAPAVPCGDDPDAHLEALAAFVDSGFDTVYVNQIGKDQQGFFDFYRTKVLPRLRD
jgi:G6PDH family F420-dependent oxidoreductase